MFYLQIWSTRNWAIQRHFNTEFLSLIVTAISEEITFFIRLNISYYSIQDESKFITALHFKSNNETASCYQLSGPSTPCTSIQMEVAEGNWTTESDIHQSCPSVHWHAPFHAHRSYRSSLEILENNIIRRAYLNCSLVLQFCTISQSELTILFKECLHK